MTLDELLALLGISRQRLGGWYLLARLSRRLELLELLELRRRQLEKGDPRAQPPNPA